MKKFEKVVRIIFILVQPLIELFNYFKMVIF